jgi:hypothetical protein
MVDWFISVVNGDTFLGQYCSCSSSMADHWWSIHYSLRYEWRDSSSNSLTDDRLLDRLFPLQLPLYSFTIYGWLFFYGRWMVRSSVLYLSTALELYGDGWWLIVARLYDALWMMVDGLLNLWMITAISALPLWLHSLRSMIYWLISFFLAQNNLCDRLYPTAPWL